MRLTHQAGSAANYSFFLLNRYEAGTVYVLLPLMGGIRERKSKISMGKSGETVNGR